MYDGDQHMLPQGRLIRIPRQAEQIKTRRRGGQRPVGVERRDVDGEGRLEGGESPHRQTRTTRAEAEQ